MNGDYELILLIFEGVFGGGIVIILILIEIDMYYLF